MATNLLYDYYSKGRPNKPQDGGLMIYKSGWRPYRATTPLQGGGSFISALKSGAKYVGKAVAPLAKSLKPVAAKVGKKLIKIGMSTLKDWAQQKNLNDAIHDNLRHAGIETANEVEQHIDDAAAAPQEGTGRRHRKRKIMTADAKKKRRKRDCFDVL